MRSSLLTVQLHLLRLPGWTAPTGRIKVFDRQTHRSTAFSFALAVRLSHETHARFSFVVFPLYVGMALLVVGRSLSQCV